MPMHICAWVMICSESSLQERRIPQCWGQNRFPLPSDKMINLLLLRMSNSDYEQLKQYIRVSDTRLSFLVLEKKNNRQANKPPSP